MATTKTYLEFIMEQMPPEVTCRAMMGEYVLYYRGRVFGGIYDNRLLIKPVAAACHYLPQAPRERPYEGAKEMLLVEQVEQVAFLRELLDGMYPELPEPKGKKKKGSGENDGSL